MARSFCERDSVLDIIHRSSPRTNTNAVSNSSKHDVPNPQISPEHTQRNHFPHRSRHSLQISHDNPVIPIIIGIIDIITTRHYRSTCLPVQTRFSSWSWEFDDYPTLPRRRLSHSKNGTWRRHN